MRARSRKPPDSWPTASRLLAALVGDGLLPARQAGDELVIQGAREIRVALIAREGEPIGPAFPHPRDLAPPARIVGVETWSRWV